MIACGFFTIHFLMDSLGDDRSLPWFRELGLSGRGMADLKWWQLLSYGALHGSFAHAILNGLLLLAIGSRISAIAGHRMMLISFFSGILAGGIAYLLLGGMMDPATVLVGCSGGCMALMLMLTTLSPDSRMMPLGLSARNVGLGILISSLLLAMANPDVGIPVFASFGDWLVKRGLGSWFQMSHACHFGGAVCGWILARWMLRPRVSLHRLKKQRVAAEQRAADRFLDS